LPDLFSYRKDIVSLSTGTCQATYQNQFDKGGTL
jgi:hypothetical protein